LCHKGLGEIPANRLGLFFERLGVGFFVSQRMISRPGLPGAYSVARANLYDLLIAIDESLYSSTGKSMDGTRV